MASTDKVERMQKLIDQKNAVIEQLSNQRDALSKQCMMLIAALDQSSAAVEHQGKQLAERAVTTDGVTKVAQPKRTGNFVCIECGNQFFVTVVFLREDGAPAGRGTIGTCNACGKDQQFPGGTG